MALVHHFSVTSKCGDYYIGNDNFDKIAIHDDIILYMIDTIKWVIGFNPSKKIFVNGLCYHGVTHFDSNLVKPFKNIIISWRDLFSNAPDDFYLTGNWITIAGSANDGEYEKISVNRCEILAKFNALIQYCEQVENDENLILVHDGI